MTRFVSLFPGLGYAAGYKIAQRIYKFGGQPWFNDILVSRYKANFTNAFGERNGKMIMQATAGRYVVVPYAIISYVELLCSIVSLVLVKWYVQTPGSAPSNNQPVLIQVLLPLDVLKIKRQVNPETFRGRGIFRIVADEGFALYRGWGWTMARNAPGSFAVGVCPATGATRKQDTKFILRYLAIWCICIYQRCCIRNPRLLQSNMDAELHRIGGRCRHVNHSGSTSRRCKDTHSER